MKRILSKFLIITVLLSCASTHASSRPYYALMASAATVSAVCGIAAYKKFNSLWHTVAQKIQAPLNNGLPYTEELNKNIPFSGKERVEFSSLTNQYNNSLTEITESITPVDIIPDGVVLNTQALIDAKNKCDAIRTYVQRKSDAATRIYKALRNAALFTGSFAATLGLRALLTKWRNS